MKNANHHESTKEQEWRNEFGKRVYQMMKEQGLTQYELAVRSDMSVGAISNIINGYSTPTVYNLLKIADVLGCTVGDLVYFH